ncbi:helix-turn-helix domain-containing protein [Sphaerimonospora cavernae]|uniref:Helix-turn-helix domain-containing protein n=1 Tax=Sphaerimonospora cavernae TaxID=1740611 RepID=A0ABV6TYQ4_9ACTN
MSVGAALSEARQRADLTVAQLSERTRIRESVIEGIERDDFSVCGGDFYARGHIRALATCLRLEAEDLVRQYDELHTSSRSPVRASAVFRGEDLVRNRSRHASNWTMAAVVALALVVVFAVVRLLSGSGGKAGETTAQLPIAVPNAGPHQVHEPGKPAQAQGVVTLKAVAKKSTWINVRDGQGHKVFQGTLSEGKATTWTAKGRMRVTVGDAGAVRLEVNGKDVGSLGKDGQTVHRTFEAGGPGAH